MYLNKAQIYGNLTRDPELRALPTGQTVANFAVATNRTYKDKDGQKKETVEYHNVVAFGKTADILGQYMKKGSPIFIEGRLQTRSWDDKETSKKLYRTEIVIESFQFGPNPNRDGAGGAGKTGAQGGAGKKDDFSDFENSAPGEITYPDDEINPEDIPY